MRDYKVSRRAVMMGAAAQGRRVLPCVIVEQAIGNRPGWASFAVCRNEGESKREASVFLLEGKA